MKIDLSKDVLLAALAAEITKQSAGMIDTKVEAVRVRIGKETFDFDGIEVTMARPAKKPPAKPVERAINPRAFMRLAASNGEQVA